MKEYVVIADLGEEAINLKATSKDDAVEKAKDVIAENYGWDFSRSVVYSVYDSEDNLSPDESMQFLKQGMERDEV